MSANRKRRTAVRRVKMAEISVRNLCKLYGDVYALDGVSFDIGDGDFVNVVGESGGGKTTLLNCIAGLVPITAGELYIDGEIVNNLPVRNRNVAMIFQQFSLYPTMTVFENIAFALKKQKMSYEEKCRRTLDMIEALGLNDIQNQLPKVLSYGQQQKTALARALVREPAIVLFDEPLSNIDAPQRETYRNLILAAKAARPRSTYLYVTHSVRDARLLGNKTMVLDRGKIVQFGETKKVFEYPMTVAVARYTHDAPEETYGVYSEGKIVTEERTIALSPFRLATMDADEGAAVTVMREKDWSALFGADGVAVCGEKQIVRILAYVRDGVLTVDGNECDLGDKKQGLLGEGEALAECSVPYFSTEPLADAAVFRCCVSYSDGVHTVFCCAGQSLPLCTDRIFPVGTQIQLYYPRDKLELRGTDGDRMLASYIVCDNVAEATVLDASAGTVRIGRTKLKLGVRLPRGGKVRLQFPTDAFFLSERSGSFAVRSVVNQEFLGKSTLVYAVIDGFENYVTAKFAGCVPHLDKKKIYWGIDGQKVRIL